MGLSSLWKYYHQVHASLQDTLPSFRCLHSATHSTCRPERTSLLWKSAGLELPDQLSVQSQAPWLSMHSANPSIISMDAFLFCLLDPCSHLLGLSCRRRWFWSWVTFLCSHLPHPVWIRSLILRFLPPGPHLRLLSPHFPLDAFAAISVSFLKASGSVSVPLESSLFMTLKMFHYSAVFKGEKDSLSPLLFSVFYALRNSFQPLLLRELKWHNLFFYISSLKCYLLLWFCLWLFEQRSCPVAQAGFEFAPPPASWVWWLQTAAWLHLLFLIFYPWVTNRPFWKKKSRGIKC